MMSLTKKFLTLVIILYYSNSSYAAPNPVPNCSGNAINIQFSSGIAWSMCLDQDRQTSLVIKQLKLTTLNSERRVLGQANLAQKDCPNGKLYPDANGRNVICTRRCRTT